MTPKPMDEKLKITDRINWQRSVDERARLIIKADEIGLILTHPHSMKLGVLAEMVDVAERWRKA